MIAPDVEGKRASDGNGNQNGDDGGDGSHIMYLHCTMIYDQLGLTIGLSLWASWSQAGLQGVAMIYGLAQVCQVSPYYMVWPVSG